MRRPEISWNAKPTKAYRIDGSRVGDKGMVDLIDDEEEPIAEEEAVELAEGAEPRAEQELSPADSSDRPVKKAPKRKRRKKMTKQELKELEEQLK